MSRVEQTGQVDLSLTSNRGYVPGRPFIVRALWLVVEAVFFLSPVSTSYRLKAWILRLFGATIGVGLIIKPNVHIKYPWHLEVGDHVWLGERSWIDNFVAVRLGSNVCVSQGAYLCTGNHDWSEPGMPLVVRSIEIEDGAWVGAFARVGPGVSVGRNGVLTLGAVATSSVPANTICSGNPAAPVGTRRIKGSP